MKRLILVRHATAVDRDNEGPDFHRRLRKRGRREAKSMAKEVATLVGAPDQLFSSPADRALETARIFAEQLAIPAERVALREELYAGPLPEEFLKLVQRFDDAASNVMVFGHDPSFTAFAQSMIPDFGSSMPKAGVLIMDIDRSHWGSVEAGDARLVHFVRPPARDGGKTATEDPADRLAAAIRDGILSAVRRIGAGGSQEEDRLIARAAKRLARDLSPLMRAASGGKKAADSGRGASQTGKPRSRR